MGCCFNRWKAYCSSHAERQNRPSPAQAQKPDWIKVRLPSNPVFFSTKSLISDLRLVTVCEEAQCPNRWECWSAGTATFMIAGERCTRACGFCAVATAKPFPLDPDEPRRVAEAIKRLKLRHVVITAVARDDLKDGGAEHFAQTMAAIREVDPESSSKCSPRTSMAAKNLSGSWPQPSQTSLITTLKPSNGSPPSSVPVPNTGSLCKSSSDSRKSLPDIATKSGVMLGLGEKEEEILQAMDDLRSAASRSSPSDNISAQPAATFPWWNTFRRPSSTNTVILPHGKGFEHISSGPLVRSSYHAAEYNPPSNNPAT